MTCLCGYIGTHGEEGGEVRRARTEDRKGGRKGGGGRGGGECVFTKLLAIAGSVALMAVMTGMCYEVHQVWFSLCKVAVVSLFILICITC